MLAIKHFRCCLLGKEFVVRTDDAPLQWLLKGTASHSGQVARWREMLSEYQVKLEYRRGLKHSNADGLSRQLCPQCNKMFGEEIDDQCWSCWGMTMEKQTEVRQKDLPDNWELLSQLQHKDANISPI